MKQILDELIVQNYLWWRASFRAVVYLWPFTISFLQFVWDPTNLFMLRLPLIFFNTPNPLNYHNLFHFCTFFRSLLLSLYLSRCVELDCMTAFPCSPRKDVICKLNENKTKSSIHIQWRKETLWQSKKKNKFLQHLFFIII